LNQRKNPLLLATGLALFYCGTVHADVVQGTILGVFSNPVLMGNIANSPSLGQLSFYDNTNTAVVVTNNSTDPALAGTPPLQATGSALVWGASAVGTPPTFSVLTFFGAPIPADINTPFKAGTFTFLNGTSDLTSLIFGATLSFYDNVISPEAYLGSDTIIITTTSNLGQAASQDADYINVCGNQSNICAKSINAIEGGAVTVDLYGTIVGDPMLTFSDVVLAAGQSTTTNGFVGNDLPLGTVPEPGAFGLIPAALLLGLGLYRRKSKLA